MFTLQRSFDETQNEIWDSLLWKNNTQLTNKLRQEVLRAAALCKEDEKVDIASSVWWWARRLTMCGTLKFSEWWNRNNSVCLTNQRAAYIFHYLRLDNSASELWLYAILITVKIKLTIIRPCSPEKKLRQKVAKYKNVPRADSLDY